MLAARKESGAPHAPPAPLAVNYFEGANVGYRWYETRALSPLFPFGYGLSYTAFSYDHLTAEGGTTLTVSCDVTNSGPRPGLDTPQFYAAAETASGHTVEHLIGWQKIALAPGETRHITLRADPRLLANFDPHGHGWHIAARSYRVTLGRFAGDAVLTGEAKLSAQWLKP
jgi:beta-glucosidase